MYRAFVKRPLDLLFAAILLALLAIPLALVALWIKFDSPGPIFFRHKRAGKNLVPFTVYKFRTMVTHAPANAPTNELRNANTYITRSGRILRKLSIDELPQLINVLKGEMSLVGPRPVVLSETELFKAREKYGANACVPGITGWAQVNGRDELRIEKKAEMDGEYFKNLGLVMDLKCILKTVWAVLLVKGHREGHQQQIDNTYSVSPVGEAE